MAARPDRLEVGRIGRPHGLRGEVAVTFTSDRAERHAPGAVLYLDDRALVVETARPHQGRWLIRFEGVAVVDVGGRGHGRVVALEANPAHDLLVLEDGALVPVVFVVSHQPGRVVVDPPAGLLGG